MIYVGSSIPMLQCYPWMLCRSFATPQSFAMFWRRRGATIKHCKDWLRDAMMIPELSGSVLRSSQEIPGIPRAQKTLKVVKVWGILEKYD